MVTGGGNLLDTQQWPLAMPEVEMSKMAVMCDALISARCVHHDHAMPYSHASHSRQQIQKS
jgi:hypothetical protein